MKARLVVLALAIILTAFQLLGPRFLAEPVGQVGEVILETMAKKTLGELLDKQLPLTLDANAIYPTVNTLPGGPFRPQPLRLTADDMDKPLPPGEIKTPGASGMRTGILTLSGTNGSAERPHPTSSPTTTVRGSRSGRHARRWRCRSRPTPAPATPPSGRVPRRSR